MQLRNPKGGGVLVAACVAVFVLGLGAVSPRGANAQSAGPIKGIGWTPMPNGMPMAISIQPDEPIPTLEKLVDPNTWHGRSSSASVVTSWRGANYENQDWAFSGETERSLLSLAVEYSTGTRHWLDAGVVDDSHMGAIPIGPEKTLSRIVCCGVPAPRLVVTGTLFYLLPYARDQWVLVSLSDILDHYVYAVMEEGKADSELTMNDILGSAEEMRTAHGIYEVVMVGRVASPAEDGDPLRNYVIYFDESGAMKLIFDGVKAGSAWNPVPADVEVIEEVVERGWHPVTGDEADVGYVKLRTMAYYSWFFQNQPQYPDLEITTTVGTVSDYCFPAGTKVHTATGLENIEDIVPGDYVLSRDDETGIDSYQRVEGVTRNTTTQLTEVTAGGEVIRATPGHRFHVDGDWVRASELRPGQALSLRPSLEATAGRQADGPAPAHRAIDAVRTRPVPQPVAVYNLRVANNHTYYVGDAGILVHNHKCRPADLKSPKWVGIALKFLPGRQAAQLELLAKTWDYEMTQADVLYSWWTGEISDVQMWMALTYHAGVFLSLNPASPGDWIGFLYGNVWGATIDLLMYLDEHSGLWNEPRTHRSDVLFDDLVLFEGWTIWTPNFDDPFAGDGFYNTSLSGFRGLNLDPTVITPHFASGGGF